MDKMQSCEEFLAKVRLLIKNEKRVFWLQDCTGITYKVGETTTMTTGQKNQYTLSKLGFTLSDAYDKVMDLQYKHYVSGPESDDKPERGFQVWIFKKYVKEVLIYIKITIKKDANNESVLVMSFHYDKMLNGGN